jgi:hypothetical protein
VQGIDPEEIIAALRTRRAPMRSASAGLRLCKPVAPILIADGPARV